MPAVSLFERHRPSTFSEVVGQPEAVAVLCRLLQGTGLAGRSYWLAGPSGCGKTTLAKLIAAHVTGGDGFVQELNATELSARDVRDIEESMAVPTLFGGRAWIVNEAHGLRKDVLRQWLTVLESPWLVGNPDVSVIFTTSEATPAGDLVQWCALLDRCVHLPLVGGGNPAWLSAIAEAARNVAKAEGEAYDLSLAQWTAFAKAKRGSLRAILQAIEAGQVKA